MIGAGGSTVSKIGADVRAAGSGLPAAPDTATGRTRDRHTPHSRRPARQIVVGQVRPPAVTTVTPAALALHARERFDPDRFGLVVHRSSPLLTDAMPEKTVTTNRRGESLAHRGESVALTGPTAHPQAPGSNLAKLTSPEFELGHASGARLAASTTPPTMSESRR